MTPEMHARLDEIKQRLAGQRGMHHECADCGKDFYTKEFVCTITCPECFEASLGKKE